jgi:hypothetical protein
MPAQAISADVSSSTSEPSERVFQPEIEHARRRPYRVVVHGLRFFCQKLPELLSDGQWDIRDRSSHTAKQLVRLTQELGNCDLVFSWGGRIDMGRFLWAARALRVRKLVFFWCGSDVLRARAMVGRNGIDRWIAQQIHWAASPMLTDEVRSLGLPCEFVQASFVESVRNPKPLPKDFSVIVFMPKAELGHLYGWDRIVEVANSLPDVKFNLVGLHPGEDVEAPVNVSVHYRIEDLTEMYEQSTVLWRPVRHDAGISFMALEALAHGRHVLYTYPLDGATQVSSTHEALRELRNLKALHDAGKLNLNDRGRESVENSYTREVVRRTLHHRWKEIIAS